MHCTTCQRDTTPIRVDGQSYCSNCSNLYRPAEPRRSMDLIASPGAAGGSGAATPAPKPVAPMAKPPAPVAPRPMSAGRSSADLHARPKASPVLDLRPKTQGPSASAAPPPAAEPKTALVSRTPRQQLHAAPGAAVQERHISQFSDRFERARRYGRSAQIARFGADIHGNVLDPAKMYDKFGNPTLHTLTGSHEAVTHGPHAPAATASRSAAAPPSAHTATPAPPPRRELPQLAATQHAAMARLAATAPPPPAAPPPATPKPSWRPGAGLPVSAGRLAATGAAVVVMAGYIWFHNYPKLTIQNAGARAGITASLPSYLPSSYTLAATRTKSGLVSLKFTSPSAAAPLTITQQSSSWDPSSLLDNYVAKNADDYDAVAGQGLTIYLFGQNTATWVNHGIWYSIAGASQLSRDQVLKIAYSL